MKLLVGVIAVSLMLAGGAVALADIDESEFPPTGGQETIVYVWIGTAWVDITTFPLRVHDCEAFHLGDPESYYCNGEYVNDGTAGGNAGEVEVGPWKFDVEASVAQYLEARLSKNALAWYVKKPYKLIGTDEIDEDYLANSIDLDVKSNGDVRVDFVSFGPLVSTTDPTETIPSYWWLGQATMPPGPAGNWWTGDFSFPIPEDPAHPHLNYKLWNRIHTGKCTSACLYEDTGALFFVLEEQKPWVAIKQGLDRLPRADP